MARMSCGLSLLVPLCGQTQDRAELERSRIVGNRELPKVIYIVPWKKPLPDALNGKPPASVLDEVLAPIDRDVHRRHVSYHAQLASPGLAPPTPLAAPAAAAAAAPSATAPRPTPALPQEKKP
jgi:hypothetical protein